MSSQQLSGCNAVHIFTKPIWRQGAENTYSVTVEAYVGLEFNAEPDEDELREALAEAFFDKATASAGWFDAKEDLTFKWIDADVYDELAYHDPNVEKDEIEDPD